MSAIFSDVRHAVRSLSRTPVWTTMLVLTIALGVASNASVDGFVRGLITQGPPLPAGAIGLFAEDGQRAAGPLALDQVAAMRARTDLFRAVGAVRETQDEALFHKRRLLIAIASITPEAADLLQLPLTGGIIVGHRLWRDDFAGMAVTGQSLRIAGVDHRIAGVAPEWLEGLYRGREIDVWMPLVEADADRTALSYWAIGRLSDRRVEEVQRVLVESQQKITVLPYTGLMPEAAASVARIGRLLRVSAIAVFVIACANVASFLLARASARSRETAVRVAIGAGRKQLVRQVLADSVVIAIAGAISGAILAFWIARIVPSFLFEEDARQMVFAAGPGGVLLIAAACSLITIVCGLLPIIETRHDNPGAIIQRENSGPSRASIRLGAGLVVMQMTACTLLVISAGLLLGGFRSALQTTAGRRLSNPVLATVWALPANSKAEEETSGFGYLEGTARAAQEVVEATSFAWASTVPGNNPVWQAFEFETPNTPLREMAFVTTPFTPKTLDTLVLPPLAGRLFGTLDAGPCGGVVITREAALEIGADPIIGRSIELPSGDWSEIVGVVDVREESVARVFHYSPLADASIAAEAMATYRSPRLTPSQRTVLDVNVVSANYFDFIGLPLIAGRSFAEKSDACRVAIVNQDAADLYFSGDAVGAAIIDRLGRRSRVIGVVGSTALRATQRGAQPAVYFPMQQDFQPRMTMIAETNDVDRAALRRLHRRIALIPGGREDKIIVTTLDDHLSHTAFAPERIATVLVGASATIALALGMLGLYGIMSDASRRRQREFALRIALGARGGHVFGQVISEGARLVIAGTVAGMLGSILVGRWVSRIAPTDEPLSPWIWIAAPLALAVAVMAASVLPARKALSSNPLMIMKDDY